MRRILMVLLTTVLILVAVIFLITQWQALPPVIQRGQGVISFISFILALLQLAGIVLGLALFVFILVQYTQFILPRRFVFQGFSNLAKLIEAEKMPLDLDMLAQEELVYQFQTLYSEWKKHSDDPSRDTPTGIMAQILSTLWKVLGKKNSNNPSPDADAIYIDELYFKESSSEQSNGKYIPPELIKDNVVLEDLRAVIQSLKDAEDINLVNLAGEIAPKEVTPIIKFIEAIFPPHTIRATGHLQWTRKEPGKAGMTFEFVDLGSRRNLMVRTLWWKSSEKKPVPAGKQSGSHSRMVDEVSTNGEQANQKQIATLDDEIALASGLYRDLLRPAMRWLALMFWEQRMASHTPLMHYILKDRGRRRQARLLYLLGALYYASANQFPEYTSFFCQLAVEYFRRALNKDTSWSLPCLYLANLYSFKMRKSDGDKVQQQKLQKEALDLYTKALERVTKEGDNFTRQRILVAKVWTELVSGDKKLANTASQEVEQLESLGPANFDPERSDCGSYLYNLAVCYILARKSDAHFNDMWGKARRTLAYCLVRAWELKDMINQNLKTPPDIASFLKLLEQVLNKKLDKLSQLSKLTGKSFEAEIDMILQEVKELEDSNDCNVDRE